MHEFEVQLVKSIPFSFLHHRKVFSHNIIPRKWQSQIGGNFIKLFAPPPKPSQNCPHLPLPDFRHRPSHHCPLPSPWRFLGIWQGTQGEDGSPIGNGNLWVPSRISEVWKSINLDSHIGFKLQRTWFYLVLWGFEWIYSQWNRDPLPIGGETNILPKLVGEYWWTTLIQILIDQRTGGP